MFKKPKIKKPQKKPIVPVDSYNNLKYLLGYLCLAKKGQVNIRTADREFLLQIKNGKYEYDDLVHQAKVKLDERAAYSYKQNL